MTIPAVAPVGTAAPIQKPPPVEQPSGPDGPDAASLPTFFAALAALVPQKAPIPIPSLVPVSLAQGDPGAATPDSMGGMLSGIARAVVNAVTPVPAPAITRVSTIVSAGAKVSAPGGASPLASLVGLVDAANAAAKDASTNASTETKDDDLNSATASAVGVSILAPPQNILHPDLSSAPPIEVSGSETSPDRANAFAQATEVALTLRELLESVLAAADAPNVTATIEATDDVVTSNDVSTLSVSTKPVALQGETAASPEDHAALVRMVAAPSMVAAPEQLDATDMMPRLVNSTPQQASRADNLSKRAADAASELPVTARVVGSTTVGGPSDSLAGDTSRRDLGNGPSHRDSRHATDAESAAAVVAEKLDAGRGDSAMNVPLPRSPMAMGTVGEVGQTIRMQASAPDPTPIPVSGNQVTIELDSANGSDRVRVAVRGGLVHATILTDASRADMLTAQLPDLRRALVDRGFVDARVSVRVPTAGGEMSMAAPVAQDTSVRTTRASDGSRESSTQDEPAAERRQASAHDEPPRGGRRREPEEERA